MAWYSSESDREQRDAVARKIDRLIASGHPFIQVRPPKKGPQLVSSFWAKAWCHHLESYLDYESRLPRGRSYLRNGHVYNLEIQPGLITAQVTGSDIYDVQIPITPFAQENLRAFQEACTGSVSNLLDLLSGALNHDLLHLITHPKDGLFPAPKQIRFVCSCPDWASLCKHAAAVLYGVALRFEADPSLFFLLRGIDPADLIAHQPLQTTPVTTEIPEEDLAALFGIELATDLPPAPVPTPTAAKKPAPKRKGQPRKTK
jgi:uncharacterized Zn finger protein